jgi:1-acyl-sn-glycerol-3-phosphate acyltransferase
MANAMTRALAAAAALTSGLRPTWMRELQEEIDACVDGIPSQRNAYGFDRYGMNPEWVKSAMLPTALLYRHYFRVDTVGIENLPEGRVLVVANHAGQLPFDAMMLSTAMLLEAEPPRLARGMAEYWVSELPFVSVAAARTGSLVGTPRNCVALLEAEECVMVFPEGVRGMNKLYRDRYRLQRFGMGFMRIALETGTPIVPVSIVGSEEQQPGLANLTGVARLFGMPALPITPTFPLLGPLGLLPLPVKYRIEFGAPLVFEGDPADEERHIAEKVDVVRTAIDRGFERGRRARTSIFGG